jgi:hypothetical protein
MVGPGVGEGFSSIPKGGFQQLEINEIMRQRKSVDELRAESNPKITYEGIVVPGKALATQRGDLGETRKYRPDTFFLNENGERNFVTATADTLKPRERAAEVLKYQSRVETSSEFIGPAGAADFSATYAVPSFRAPLARQQDGFGMRHADGSAYGVADTDAKNNDFGAANYEILTNQRNVTSERGQALNLVEAGAPKALTVYDPNDVARVTVRESTGANDFIGISSPDGAAQKLTRAIIANYEPATAKRVLKEIHARSSTNQLSKGTVALTRDGAAELNKLAKQLNVDLTFKSGQPRPIHPVG